MFVIPRRWIYISSLYENRYRSCHGCDSEEWRYQIWLEVTLAWFWMKWFLAPPDWNISSGWQGRGSGIVDNIIIRVWDPGSATIETFHIIKVGALESTHDLRRNLSRPAGIETGDFTCHLLSVLPSVVTRGSPCLIEMQQSGKNLGSFTCTCVRTLAVCEKLWTLFSSSCQTEFVMTDRYLFFVLSGHAREWNSQNLHVPKAAMTMLVR